MPRRVLAFDIGGTKLSVALIRGAEVESQLVVPTPASDGPEAVLASAVVAGRRLLDLNSGVPEGIAVACAGVVKEGRFTALSPELLPGWHDFPLVERFELEFPHPVVALNDAQAAAYGEAMFGAGRGRNSFLFITVSTGVGGGLVLGERLWTGASGLAGHIGHIRGGFLERVTSGTALERRAGEAGRPMGAREVIEAAASGQPWASELLNDASRALVAAIGDVRLLFDPDVTVLGGGVGLNPTFREAVIKTFATVAPHKRMEVKAAQLGASAGLIGVASWASDLITR